MRGFFWMKTFHHNSHVFLFFFCLTLAPCQPGTWTPSNDRLVWWRSARTDRRKKKHSRLLQPRDARRNVITRRLLHIAKPADMLSFAGSPPSHPTPTPPLRLLCSAICLGCCPPVVLMRVFSTFPLLFLSHLQGGKHMEEEEGGTLCLDFLLSCLFVSNAGSDFTSQMHPRFYISSHAFHICLFIYLILLHPT